MKEFTEVKFTIDGNYGRLNRKTNTHDYKDREYTIDDLLSECDDLYIDYQDLEYERDNLKVELEEANKKIEEMEKETNE